MILVMSDLQYAVGENIVINNLEKNTWLIINSVLLNQRPVEVGNNFLFVNTSWTTFHSYKCAITCEMPLSFWLPSFTVFHNKFIILIKQTNEGRCCNKIWGNMSELYKRCNKLGGLLHGGLISCGEWACCFFTTIMLHHQAKETAGTTVV